VTGFLSREAEVGNFVLMVACVFQKIPSLYPEVVRLVLGRQDGAFPGPAGFVEQSSFLQDQGIEGNMGRLIGKEGLKVLEKDRVILKGEARDKIRRKSMGENFGNHSEPFGQEAAVPGAPCCFAGSFVKTLYPKADPGCPCFPAAFKEQKVRCFRIGFYGNFYRRAGTPNVLKAL
jgi:hypothetical protein